MNDSFPMLENFRIVFPRDEKFPRYKALPSLAESYTACLLQLLKATPEEVGKVCFEFTTTGLGESSASAFIDAVAWRDVGKALGDHLWISCVEITWTTKFFKKSWALVLINQITTNVREGLDIDSP